MIELLTPHGRTPEVCESVIERFKDNPMYKDNKTVQDWVKASELALIMHNIRVP
jgi:hypothetical protein